jgi:hypothetical protein
MGAIARNIANNITTSGVFTPDALDSGSVTGITALANASDGITFISSQTASASASISFTTGIDATYKVYKFVFSNINPATDVVEFQFNLSTDSGSSYNVTKTSTAIHTNHSENDATTNLYYQTASDLAQSTAYQQLCNDCLGSGADESGSGTMLLFNPSSTTYVKHFISTFHVYHGGDLAQTCHHAGYGNTTSAINAINFKMSSGNFDGTIYLYGIK